MPSPVAIRRVVLQSRPSARSAGDWDLVPGNLLKDPRAFSTALWTKTRSYIAANCAADPETGLFTADKLVEDGTASNDHRLQQEVTLLAGSTCFVARVKASGREWVRLVGYGASTSTVSSYFRLVGAGTVGTQSGAVGTITQVGEYYDCKIVFTAAAESVTCYVYFAEADNDITYSGLGHQGTAAVGGSTSTLVMAAGASAVDDVYNGTDTLVFSDAPTVWHTVTDYVGATKTAAFTPARASAPDGTTYTVGPGILIARAQLNPGTTPWTFFDGGDMQTWAPTFNIGGNVVLGAGSSSDANDPAIVGTGLSFAGSHFAKSASLGAAKGFDLAFYVGTAVSSASTAMMPVCLPRATGLTRGLYFGTVTAAQTNEIVTMLEEGTDSAAWCHASDTIPVGWHILQVNWTGSVWQLWIDNVEKSLTVAGTPVGFSLAGVVQLGSSQTPAAYFTGIIGHYQHHTASRSASQRMRDYRAVQAAMARKQVTVPS